MPEGWSLQRLDETKLNVLPGFAFKSELFKRKGIPLIRVRDVDKEDTEIKYDGLYDEQYIINKNEIIVGMDGEFKVTKWNGPLALLNQRVCRLKTSDSKTLDNDFLYYAIQKPIKEIERITPKTTVIHLSTKDIRKIELLIPPLVEQRGIAEVLSTVDEAIRQTDAIIAKAEELKRGLMQRLLTRGIGHTEFKQTELGEIPKTWDIVNLEEICDFLDHMRIPIKEEERSRRKGPYPYYGAQGIIDYIDGYLFEGDHILLAEDGANLITKRIPIAFKASGKFWVNNHAHVLRCKDDVNLYYLINILNNINIRRHVIGSAQPKLNQSDARLIKIKLPPINEQLYIANIINSYNFLIQNEFEYKKKLHDLKQGLMQILLSGRVRVRLDEGGLHRIGNC